MEITKKSQISGDNSVNLQAENITINAGLSISHVKEAALEVFEANFYRLSGVAKEIADQRAKEITEQFLNELAIKNPEGLKSSEDPDFQHSLFQAQKEYARFGDKELGDILVDILVERSKVEERSLLQVVLNESLLIAPKLTSTQLDILACSFNIGYTRRLNIQNIQMFADYLNNDVLAFADAVGKKDSNYQHLEYVGCTAIRAGQKDFISHLTKNYKAIFCKGFEIELLKDFESENPKIREVIMPCLHNVNLFQAGGMDDAVITEMCREQNISQHNVDRLIQINNQQIMSKQEAIDFLKSICPKFEQFLSDVSNSSFKSLDLTSVEIAIAHAHSRKKVGFSADLSIWI